MNATALIHPTATPGEHAFDLRGHATDSYRALLRLERTVSESALDVRTRDLVKVRASMLNGCAFCIDMHTKDARAAGETEQRLYALGAWHEAPFFDARERAALALCDALTQHCGEPEVEEARDIAAEHLSGVELAGLIFAIATINTWNRVVVASGAVAGAYQPQES
jgi:AhpD family alkylhydroperoxidase